MDCLEITTNVNDDIELALTWIPNNANMETGQSPTISNFTLLVDDVERTIESLIWTTGTVLSITAMGTPAGAGFKFTQDLYDSNVQNTDGVKAIPGQSVDILVP